MIEQLKSHNSVFVQKLSHLESNFVSQRLVQLFFWREVPIPCMFWGGGGGAHILNVSEREVFTVYDTFLIYACPYS